MSGDLGPDLGPDPRPDLRPDLRHVTTWLFDLDDTLYPAESGLMAEVVRRMTQYVMQVTGLPYDEAFRLQKTYLADHGITLRGLMLHHGVDPEEFAAVFHDISLDILAHDPDLVRAIAALPGRRLIFTNADNHHAERVLERLGLAHLFEHVAHIGSFDYTPKPEPEAFRRLFAEHAVTPGETAFFEDSERNLKPAAEMGVTTVLVGPHAAASTAPFVHYRTERLTPFLTSARLRQDP